MPYDPEHHSPESSGVPLTRELFDLIDHTAILVDFLDDQETAPIAESTDTELTFNWKSLDEAIVPEIVQSAIDSGFVLSDVTIKTALLKDSHRYSVSVEFALTHSMNPPLHIAAVLLSKSTADNVPTGWRQEGSDENISDDMLLDELKTFIYSLIYDQDEIAVDHDEIMAKDINSDQILDDLIPYFKRVSESYSVTRDYNLPTLEHGVLEIRSEEFVSKPDVRVIQAYITVQFPPGYSSQPVYASAYIDLTQNDPVELYLYFRRDLPLPKKSLVRVHTDDPHIQYILDAIRSAVATTPRGQEYFISNQALEDLYNDPDD